MMRFGAYVLFCICIGISLWFFGFTTPITYILGIQPTATGQTYNPQGSPVYQGKPLEATSFIQNIGQLMSSTPEITKLLGILTVVIGVAALTGFSSMYFVPVLLLLMIVNYVCVPINSSVLQPVCANATDPAACTNAGGAMPDFIYYPLLLIMNALGVMAAVSFIRGGV